MLLKIIGFLLVGRLLIFLTQEFPFQKVKFIGKYFKEGKFLEQLLSCDLCAGCYIFAILAYIYKMDFIGDLLGIELPVLNYIISGFIASFVVHIFRIGWSTKFAITIVEK